MAGVGPGALVGGWREGEVSQSKGSVLAKFQEAGQTSSMMLSKQQRQADSRNGANTV